MVTILRALPSTLWQIFFDDPSELAVPPFVILPAGETTAVFDLAVDESRQANSREVTLTASAPGWSQGVVTVKLKKMEQASHDKRTKERILPALVGAGIPCLSGWGEVVPPFPARERTP